jgi:hypothetical protein
MPHKRTRVPRNGVLINRKFLIRARDAAGDHRKPRDEYSGRLLDAPKKERHGDRQERKDLQRPCGRVLMGNAVVRFIVSLHAARGTLYV